MSFVAGLLARELPTVSRGAGASGSAGTTPVLAVLPRLASRYEEAGAPLWRGSGNATLESEAESGAETGPGQAPRSPAAPRPAFPTGPVPAGPGPATRTVGGLALRPAPAAPGSLGYPPGPVTERRAAVAQHRGDAGPPPPAPVIRPVLRPAERPAQEAPGLRHGETQATTPRRQDGVVRGQAAATAVPAAATRARREPAPQPVVPATGMLRPRLEPLVRRETVRAPEQHIHVHIGRIEVKAVAAPATRPAAPERTRLMSLDEYLEGRP